MLVRESCGGRNKITEALRAQCRYIDILIDNIGSECEITPAGAFGTSEAPSEAHSVAAC